MSTREISSYSLDNPADNMSLAPLPSEIDSENMQIANCFRRLAFASALAGGAALLCGGICTVAPGAQLAAAPLLIAGTVCAAAAIVFALISCGLSSIENQSRLTYKMTEKSIDKEDSSETESIDGETEEEDLSEVSYRKLTKEENEKVALQYQQIVESSRTDLGKFRPLPKETIQHIIMFAKTLHSTALVCKAWKVISFMVHRDIFPFDTIFGVQAYETLTVKAAGKIPPLPLRAHQALEEDKEVSLIAKAIIRINEDGTEGKVEVLSSRLFMELTGGPTNKGHKIELLPAACWQDPFDIERPPSESYWLCRGTKTISKDKKITAQTQDVKEEGVGYVTNLREILISVGGNYGLNGKSSPMFDMTDNWDTLVRVSDRSGEQSPQFPLVTFYPSEDGLSPARLNAFNQYDFAVAHIGVVPARKSIGT